MTGARSEDPITAGPANSSGWRGPLAVVGVVGALIAAVIGLGAANPVRTPGVSTDRLGPSPGTSVDEYVITARDTLADSTGEQRWALVSLTEHMSIADFAGLASGVRVSVVYAHVAIDRVQTPIVAVPVPDNPTALADAVKVAGSGIGQQVVPSGERDQQILAVSRSRLAADCACVAAALVHAPVKELRTIANSPKVRAVEALPPDAVFGRFAITPLLPEQLGVVGVLPDDGPVPAT